VTGARWDDAEGAWTLATPRGTYVVENLILANGGLAEPRLPDIPGLDRFRGSVMHSAAWDHSVGLTGKRIAVIGTGASAIQIVPHLQRTAEKLFVFQRTPAWVLPHTDRPIGSAERALYRRFPIVQRILRKTIYLTRELLVLGLTKDRRLLRPLAALARRQIRRNVADPELQRKLTPSYELGCKRILLSDHFYPAIAAPNARLVTEPIASFTEGSIITQDGQEREVDAVVLATGFRVTDNPVMELIVGREGESLASSWRASGMRAYLGTTVNGFPNLFIMTGPNTGIGHTSLLVMAEAQITYILEALKFKERSHVRRLEVTAEAVEKFTDEVQSKMKGTVWTMGGCASWYLDDQGRNTTLWPDHTWRFRRLTKSFDPAAYLVDRPTDLDLEAAVSI
jgi:cation diffusion facilitator CzcD-associated flavoprotein CzcO